MASLRSLLVAAVLVTASACGGGSSNDPAPTATTDRPGQSIGVADAIDRTRQVAEQAEERANLIDQLAPPSD